MRGYRAGARVAPRARVLVRAFTLATAFMIGIVASGPGATSPGTDESDPLSSGIIPGSLEEALERLQSALPAAETEKIRAGQSSPADWDRTVGPRILKDWIEPPDSALTAYFRKLGIDHPQDISGILRRAYWLYLNGRLTPVELTRMVRSNERYWARLLTPEKAANAEALSDAALKNPALLQSAYARDAKLIGDDFDGNTLDERVIPLIIRERTLRDAWTARELSMRASPDASDYQEIITKLSSGLDVITLSLGTAITLISISEGSIGQFVIASGAPRRPPELWRIDLNVPASGAWAEQLHCWRSVAGARPCTAVHVGAMPPDVQHQPRFYIEAAYAQQMGATRGRQLSLWRWDGSSAIPIYVTSYNVGGDAENQGVTAAGDIVRIGAKGSYQTLWACGACDGRQLVRRLELTASDQIQDLGTRSLTPEMDRIDLLYTLIKNHRPTGDLATPEALHVIERTWNDTRRGGAGSLLMNEPEEVTTTPGGSELCFLANYLTSTPVPAILFRFTGSGPELRLVGARELDPSDGRSCAAAER